MAGGVRLATAYYELIPSMQGAQRAISSQLNPAVSGAADEAAREGGSRLTSGFSSSLSQVGNVLKGILAYQAIAGVGEAFKAAGSAIIGFNSTLQSSTIAFTTMLGSGEKAQSFLDQLQAFAKATPFEFQGLVQNSQLLLGMGISAQDIIPDLTALGDSVASVGGGADVLNNTILAFSQISSKGTLSMDNLNQLLQGGVPTALKVLAAQFHVTTGQMTELISTGKVAASDALPKLISGLENGTSATAALGGMMDKQSTTLTGAMSNISDAATQLLAAAFKPLFDQASLGAQGLAVALSSPKLTHFGSGIASGLTSATAAFNAVKAAGVEAASQLSSFFSSANTLRVIDSVFTSLGQSAVSIGVAFAPLGASFVALIPQFAQLAGALSPTGLALKALLPVLPTLAASLTSLGVAIGTALNSAIQNVLPGLLALSASLAGALSTALVAILPVVTNIVIAVLNLATPVLASKDAVIALTTAFVVWKATMATIGLVTLIADLVLTTRIVALYTIEWVKNTVAMVASKAETVAIAALYAGQFVAGVAAATVALVANRAETLAISALYAGEFLVGLATSIAALATQTGSWVANAAAMLAARVAMIAGVVATGAATAAQWLLNAALDANPIGLVIVAVAALVAGLIYFFTQTKVGQAIFAGFTAFLQTAWQVAVAAVTAAVSFLASNFIARFNGIRDVVMSVAAVFASLATGAAAGFNAVVSLAGSLKEKVTGALAGAGSWLTGIGGKIIDGLISGIKGAFGDVKSALGTLTSLIPSWKGPASLDKVLLFGNGQLIIGGLVDGFDSRSADVHSSLTALTNSIPASVNASIPGVSVTGGLSSATIGQASSRPIYTDNGALVGLIHETAQGVARFEISKAGQSAYLSTIGGSAL